MTDILRLDQTIARDQTSQPLMWMVVSRALAGYSVRSGLAVTQRAAGANMSVDVAAGTYLLNNVPGTYAATTNVAVDAADGSNPRLDTLYISSSGVLTILKGTAAAISPSGETDYKKFEAPYPADLSGTAGIPLAIIHVGAGVSTITDANIWMIGSMGVGVAGSVSVEVPYDAADEVIYDTPGLKCDGSNDYVTHSAVDLSGTGLTVMLRFNEVNPGAVGKGYWNQDYAQLDNVLLIGHVGSVRAYIGRTGTMAQTNDFGPPVYGEVVTYHFTFDVTGNAVKCFKNGVQFGTTWTPSPALSALLNRTIELGRFSGSNYFGGVWHKHQVWKRVLTDAEIADDAADIPVDDTGLVICQDFSDGSGTTLTDSSGDGNHGTLTNFADTTFGAGVFGESGWVVPTNAKPLLTMPANGFVRFVGKVVATAYDNGFVTVGEDGDKDSLMTAVLVDAQGTTNDTYTPNKYYASGSVIKAFITPHSDEIDLYTTPEVVGNAASGGATSIAGKVFGPIDCSGLTKANGTLSIDVKYVGDALNRCTVELTSSGTYDNEEWTTSIRPLIIQDGDYHTYEFPLATWWTEGSEMDPSEIDYIRIYGGSESGDAQFWWKNAKIMMNTSEGVFTLILEYVTV